MLIKDAFTCYLMSDVLILYLCVLFTYTCFAIFPFFLFFFSFFFNFILFIFSSFYLLLEFVTKYFMSWK